MKEYMLIAKGKRETWDNASDEDWDQVMQGFGTWIAGMKEKNLWGRSGRLTPKRIDIEKEKSQFKTLDGPFTETKELTGFFIFKAENMDHAIECAKLCPSLLHDSLSLHELDGDC